MTNDWAARVERQNNEAKRLGNPEYVVADEARFLDAIAAALRDAEKRLTGKSPAAANFCSKAAGELECASKERRAPAGSLPAKAITRYHANECAMAAQRLMSRIEQLSAGDGLPAKKLSKLADDMEKTIVAAAPPRVTVDVERYGDILRAFLVVYGGMLDEFSEDAVDGERVGHRMAQIEDLLATGSYLRKEDYIGLMLGGFAGYTKGRGYYRDLSDTGMAAPYLTLAMLRDVGVITESTFEDPCVARAAWRYPFRLDDYNLDEQVRAFCNGPQAKILRDALDHQNSGALFEPEDAHMAYVESQFEAQWVEEGRRHRTPDAAPVKAHLTPEAHEKLLARLGRMPETKVRELIRKGEITEAEAHGHCAGAGWRLERGDDCQLGDFRERDEESDEIWFDGDEMPPHAGSFSPESVLPYGCWTLADGTQYLYDRSYASLWRRTPDGVVTQADGDWIEHDKEIPIYDGARPPRSDMAAIERCIAVLKDWGVRATPDPLPPFNGSDAKPAKKHQTVAARKKLLSGLGAMSETSVQELVDAGDITAREAHGLCAGAGWRTHRGNVRILGDFRPPKHKGFLKITAEVLRGEIPPVSSYSPESILPYGLWKLADGSEVLFCRGYHPLWRRGPDGVVTRAKSGWVVHIEQHHFYDDDCPPRNNVATVERCIVVLVDWGVRTTPDPLPAYAAEEATGEPEKPA